MRTRKIDPDHVFADTLALPGPGADEPDQTSSHPKRVFGPDPDATGMAALLPRSPMPETSGGAGSLHFRHAWQNNLDDRFNSILTDTSVSLGRPLTITSGYRPPEYNRSVGGANQSRHMHGDAADIDMRGMTAAQRKQLVQELRANGAMRFGAYANSPHMLHVDMKDQRGDGTAHFMFNKSQRHMASAPAWFREVAADVGGGTVPGAGATKTSGRVKIREIGPGYEARGAGAGPDHPLTAAMRLDLPESGPVPPQRPDVDALTENERNAAHNQAMQEQWKRLEAEYPGRFKLMTEEEYAAWKQEFDEKHGSEGVLGDIRRTLISGAGSADEASEWLLQRIPVLGPAIDGAIDTVHEFVHGQSYQRSREEMVDRAEATRTPEWQEGAAAEWVIEHQNSDGSTSYRAGPAWANPRSYGNIIVGSIPATAATMAPGGLMARGAYLSALARGASQSVASQKAATTALVVGSIVEGLHGGAETAVQIRKEIEAIPPEVLADSEALKSLVDGGLTREEALEKLTGDAEVQGFLIAGVATAAFGGQGDRALATIIGDGVGGGLMKRIAAGATRGAVAEGVIEEAPQSIAQQAATNLGVQSVDPSRRIGEGVPNAAAAGLVGGAGVGGGLGAAGGAASPARSAEELPVAEPPVEPEPATAEPKGTLAAARDRALEREAARAATEPGTDAAPAPDQASAAVSPAPAESTAGPFERGQTVVIDTGQDGFDPFMATVDSVAGGEVVVFNASTGEYLQVPSEFLKIIAWPHGNPDSVMTEAPEAEPSADPVTRLEPITARADPGEPEADEGRSLDTVAVEPGTPAPPLPEPVDVDPPPTVARAETATEPAVETQPELPAAVGQVQAELPIEQDRRAEEEAAGELPIGNSATPNLRTIGNREAEFHDETLAALYDLGSAIQRGRLNSRLTAGRVDKLLEIERRRVAEQLGVSESRIREVADDYRYRVERMARDGSGRFKAPVVNAILLARLRSEQEASRVSDLETAAAEAATSPKNDLPEPTSAQKAAGNYRLGHTRLGGLDLSIENPAGSTRSGTSPDGKTWSREMRSHYGYIRGTVGRDKDHIDAFVRPETKRINARSPVFVIDQVDDKGEFDEHKVMLGFPSEKAARAAYLENYEDGWDGLGAVSRVTLDQFKSWLRDGDTKRPFAPRAAPITDRSSDAPVGSATATDTDAGETASVALSPDGDWNFNDTYPAPDPAKTGPLRKEGRDAFETDKNGRFDPADVSSVIEETLNDLVIRHLDIAAAKDELADVEAGGTGRRKDPEKERRRINGSIRDDRQALREIRGALLDQWPTNAADAIMEEAKRRAVDRGRNRQDEGAETRSKSQPKNRTVEADKQQNAGVRSVKRKGPEGQDLTVSALLERAREFKDPISVVERAIRDPEATHDAIDTMRADVRRYRRALMNKHGVASSDSLADAPISKEEEQFLYYVDEPTDPAEYRNLTEMIEPVDDLSEAEHDIRAVARDLPESAEIDDAPWYQRVAAGRLVFLGSEINRLGGNPEDVIKKSVMAEASRYRDPDDAEFMARNLLERLRPFVDVRPGSVISTDGAEQVGQGRKIPRNATRETVSDWARDLGIDNLDLGDRPGDRARDMVLEQGKSSGREYLIALDEHGDVIANIEGNSSATGITKLLREAMNSPDESIVIHHNHPSGRSLSETDLFGAASPGVHSIYAHAESGSSYRAAVTPRARRYIERTLGGARPDRGLFQSFRPAFPSMTSTSLEKAMFDHVSANPDALETANADYHHLLNRALHEAGWIRYTTNRSESVLLDIAEIRRAFDDTVKAFRAKIGDDTDDRSADTVRHPGELEGFLEGDGTTPSVSGTQSSDRRRETPPPRDGGKARSIKRSAPRSSEKAERIEDFGEKLEGARKDEANAVISALGDENIDIASEPLSKSFPVPNYERLAGEGVDIRVLALVAAIRAGVPTIPRRKFRLQYWVDEVRRARESAEQLLSGTMSRQEFEERSGESSSALLTRAPATARVLREIEPSDLHRASRWSVEVYRSLYRQGGRTDRPEESYVLVDPNRRATNISANNLDDLIVPAREAITEWLNQSSGSKRTPKPATVGIYQDRRTKEYFLGFRGRGMVLRLQAGFETLSAANAYREENADTLQEQIRELRKGPRERRPENEPRSGKTWVEGDVTPEMFQNTFGFRGVQFGNYVESDKRQTDLNQAYDALMDLADVVSVPPRAVSLGGQLGLAFGARGRGGPANAHFEPDSVVINLTKKGGAGSLAHEWFHAVDNYFRRQDGSAGRYITEQTGHESPGGIRPEVFAVWKEIAALLRRGEFSARSRRNDAARSKPYFSKTIEKAARAFERYVYDRLRAAGHSNDYLVNIDTEGGAYPTEAEMRDEGHREAFDRLFGTLDTRQTQAGDVELYSINPRTGSDLGPGLTEADREAVRDIVKQVAGLDDVTFTERIELPRGDRGWGTNAPTTASGSYDPVADVVTIALDTGTDRTAYHEAFHRLQHLFLSPQEHAALRAETGRLRRIVRTSMSRRGQVAGMSQKELEAEAFAIYAVGRSKTKPYRGFRAAWDRIAVMLRRVANFLAGRGIQTSEDIFDRALAGEVAGRGAEADPASQVQFTENPPAPRTQGLPAGSKTMWIWRNVSKLKAHPDYAAAKAGDPAAAIRVVEDVVDDKTISKAREAFGTDVIYVPVFARERAGTNKLPIATAAVLASATGAQVRYDILQTNEAFHTGAKAMERIVSRPRFDGPIEEGARYVVVDDVTVMGSTLAELADHIVSNGGEVVGNVTLVNASREPELVPDPALLSRIQRRFGDEIEQILGIRPEALTRAEARYVLNFKTAKSLRNRGAKARRERSRRLDDGTPPKEKTKKDYSVNPSPTGTAPSRDGLSRETIVEAIRGKLTDLKPHMMSLVPLNYFPDLARPNMGAVAQYLDVKRAMDTYRGTKHAEADEIAQRWLKYSRMGFGRDGKARAAVLARLMHDATLAGVDPSVSDTEMKNKPGYPDLRKRFDALPRAGQKLFGEVRDLYKQRADETDAILLKNVETAFKIAEKQAEARYRQELDQIDRSDQTKKQKERARKEAAAKHKAERQMAGFSMRARMTKLRLLFETKRVPAPYFPLARFGDYFLTVRDKHGEVISFSKRETKFGLDRLERQMRRARPGATVTAGLLSKLPSMKSAMAPQFVADVEEIIGRVGLDPQTAHDIQDHIWQRFLETMPDLSMRKRFIHRKGTQGYDEDALRGFSSSMFHSAHQNAKLKYNLELQDLLDDIEDQAKKADDPIAGVQVSNEMKLRHEWVMKPTGGRVAQVMTSTAFVWFLAVSPAAAIVNMTQTPMLGVPILGARFGSMAGAAAAIAKASADSVAGRGSVVNARLNKFERDALKRFQDSGLIDRTQSHDLAGVGDTGVEYRPLRAKVMEIMAWAFHRAEVWNREVTGLAAYRMARKAGQTHLEAVNSAHDATWAAHFDYSNSNRPRIMQNDFAKVVLVFRQHQINMLYRLFRDINQTFKGETVPARREARRQIAGIVGMMGLFAGVSGIAGFNLAMSLADLVMGDEDDPMDFETKFRKDVLETLGPEWGGAVLNGVPGHYLGVSLTDRIGMPDLWFRGPNRELQGREEFEYWLLNSLGATVAMAGNAWRGVSMIREGSPQRGVEAIVPKWARDLMRAWRYAQEGVSDSRGNQILPVDEITAEDIVKQASGFTPAKIAETWDRNSALKNAEIRIMRKRQKLMNQYALAVKMRDDEARDEVRQRIREFNRVPAHRAVRITPETLRRSMATRRRNEKKRIDGALIQNHELGKELRSGLPETVYR